MNETELTKLLWLVGMIGFGFGLVVMLMKVDRSEEWRRAHIAQLVLNRHGGLDIAAIAFWIGLGVSVLAVVYSLFNKVTEGFIAVFGIFEAQVTTPLLFKVIFNKTPDAVPAVKTDSAALPLKTGDQS